MGSLTIVETVGIDYRMTILYSSIMAVLLPRWLSSYFGARFTTPVCLVNLNGEEGG